MKPTPRNLLSAAAVLVVAGVKSDAKSSFRGGSPSDRDVADPSSRVSPRRALQKKERHEQEMSSYWWLSKESSEKDIVYKTNVEQGGTSRTSGSNGVDSFSVFTIDVDNNPDTSELPYRAPTKIPTAKPTSSPTTLTPTSSPTETITDSPTSNVQLVSPQGIVGRTKSYDEGSYFFPLWTDVFKGCVSSSTTPQVYSYFPDEYIFSSVSTCCTVWFGSDDCSSSESMSERTFTEGNMDEYMFQSNGVEAYSGGGATSRDSSRDEPGGDRPSPLVPPPTPNVPDTLPPVEDVVASEEPTYKPTASEDGDDLGVIIVSPTTSPPVSQVTDPPVATPQAVSTLPPVDGEVVEAPATPEPTPAPIIPAVLTPYPTFGALPVATATAPPVFEIAIETNAPTAAGTGNSTIAGTTEGTIAGTTEGTTAGTTEGTTAGTTEGSTAGTTEGSTEGTISKRTAAMTEESEFTRLFTMRHRKSDNLDD